MAILVPDRAEIDSLPQKLTDGEDALMKALDQALDDNWTVYVQPHLNGLRPDIVIFSEDAGIGVFEVKDWNLNSYRIIVHEDGEYDWQVWDTGKWVTRSQEDYCPLKQVEKYRQSIFEHEIPLLDAKRLLDRSVHRLIQPIVYFHKHTTEDVIQRLKPILKPYSNVFGNNILNPNFLRGIIRGCGLRHGSQFAGMMAEIGLADRLANALAYPQHGSTDIQTLLAPFNKKQKDLLPNESGSRRVFGAAGSGKTFVLIHKAVNAARDGKKVLLVCFNITMANYLRDLVTRLARHYGSHYHRNIEVGHFHRFFPYLKENPEVDKRSMKKPIDVLLIDEGQDFERAWIQKLQKIGASGYHLMFCEDDRQNIYGKSVKEREKIPIRGKNLLKESYRIPEQTAKLANALASWAKQEGESGSVESIKSTQGNLLVRNLWFDGTKDEIVNVIREDVKELVQDKNTARADIAILVCTVKDGWQVCQVLDELKLPKPQCNFESKEENTQLSNECKDEQKNFKEERNKLRRRYRAGFWMQGGRIKVCTIHSFKGWELNNILVFFNPEEEQEEAKVPLLYTAITRSQQNLTIYNADLKLSQFGKIVISENYIEQHPKTK
ncbi:MAG: NERD domain-containing protein [Coleofasciculus sp. B1-GNL1-01]|uniref:UvrD-helicase domain-containing protein n=1 Tax=Coleofasciculus sp. B1-GNL1-01 TaxID=3068484 RepID=UPI003302E77B